MENYIKDGQNKVTQSIKMPNGGTLIVNGVPSEENLRTFAKILIDSKRKNELKEKRNEGELT